MRTNTKKKIIIIAIIFVIGVISAAAVGRFAKDNAFLHQLIIIFPAALAGFVMSSKKESDSLLPQGIKAWLGFIIAGLFITTLFWALKHYVFS